MVQHVAAIAGGLVVAVATAAGAGVLLWYLFGRKKAMRTLVDPEKKIPLRLVDRQFINHDTMMIKLGLDSPEHILGLPVGNHVYFSDKINGELVVRPYTPTSLDSQKGYVDFVIKVYKAGTHPNFPRGGKMTQYLMNLPISHYINVRGPSGNLEYDRNGVFEIKPDVASPPRKYSTKFVSMICGGSGITPMYQLIRHILSQPNDNTKLALLYANNTEGDILLRDELEALESKHRDQLRLWYTVKTAPEAWNYSTGYVDDKMISEHLYPPGDDSLVLLCGPPPMIEFACYSNLAKLNYPRDRIFAY